MSFVAFQTARTARLSAKTSLKRGSFFELEKRFLARDRRQTLSSASNTNKSNSWAPPCSALSISQPSDRLLRSKGRPKQGRRAQFQWKSLMKASCLSLGIVGVIDKSRKEDSKMLKWEERVIPDGYPNGNKPKKWEDREMKDRNPSPAERKFLEYASLPKDHDLFMTMDDFARAILPTISSADDAEQEDLNLSKIPDFFRLADVNGDGLISCSEYVMFSTLLSIHEDQIEVAFKMFDLDGNGILELEEFTDLLKVICPFHPDLERVVGAEGDSIVETFFGADGSKQLTVQEFEMYIRNLRHALLQMEFTRYTGDVRRPMSANDFALCMISYCPQSSIPGYMSRLESLKVKGGVSYEQFLKFNRVLPNLDKISFALSSFSNSKEIIRKNDFGRAVYAVTDVILSRVEIDVIFHVFDTNGDGQMDQEELMDALESRYYHDGGDDEASGLRGALSCLGGCFSRQK